MKKNTSLQILIVCLIFTACKKQDDFLNQKPNASLSTITTLSSCQLLLQDEAVFNVFDPALGEMATDDYYLPTTTYNGVSAVEQNSYLWAQTIYPAGSTVNDFVGPYRQIDYANTVLDALPNISYPASQQVLYNTIKGTALWYRARAFYNMVQTFALPYDSATAATELGIPLPLTSDFNTPVTRVNQKDCYTQITNDLLTSIGLLPVMPPIITQPSKVATYGLLARIYLAMGNYNKAFLYADTCLSMNGQLVDYNSIPTPAASARTIISSGFFVEDIFHSAMYNYTLVIPAVRSIVDSSLYNSYAPNDLRLSLFFVIKSGLPFFRGTYDYKSNNYSGIATDEIYLIRAECNARLGNVIAAMNDLNSLLIKRWKTGTFVNYTATSADDAIKQILVERRKELIFRGARWTDLRRLNKDNRFAITLTRIINGVSYTLAPNSPRYAYPFDDQEIQLTGIPQNLR